MSVRIYDVSPLPFDEGLYAYQFRGLSTDDKPLYEKMATGSEFLDIDTCENYFYDEDSGAWLKAGDDDA